MTNSKRNTKKQSKKKSESSNSRVEIPKELASKVLSAVPRENGFYFYSSIDTPTGVVACSFDEFCQSVKTSPAESLEFHLMRGDFENWIRFLGDVEMASQIEGIRMRNLPKEQLVQTLVSKVEERQGLLRSRA